MANFSVRISTIQAGAVISILGVMLQASAANLTMMLVGRIVSGFAIGMMSVGVPIYLSECAYRTDLLSQLSGSSDG